MTLRMLYFGEDKEFDSPEELLDFVEDEHSANPDSINEISEIVDTETRTEYGLHWTATLEEI